MNARAERKIKMKDRKNKRKFKLILAVAFILVLCFVKRDDLVDGFREMRLFLKKSPDEGTLELHVIDVGQGDALLVRTGSSVMLVDTGTGESKYFLKSYLKSRGVDKIDCLVCTHPHADHIGGAEYIVRNFRVGQVMLCGSDSTSPYLANLLSAIEELDIDIAAPEYGAAYELGDITFRILSPYDGFDTSSNSGSIVMRVEWGATAFMLTGDAESDAEAFMLDSFTSDELKSDFIKLAHHGSSTSTSEEFLAAVDPEWVAISCGRDNDYAHPHYEVIERLRKYGIPDDHILRTDISGTIVFVSDGEQVYINGQKPDRSQD